MVGRQQWACVALLVAGTLALLAAGLGLYARHAVLDERAFAARATQTLRQDEVVDEVADRITQRAIERQPRLAGQRPVLEAAVGNLVIEPRFPAEFHAGVQALQHALFADDRHTAQLVLPGAGRDLHAAVAARSPAVARELPPGDPEIMALGGGRLETGLRDAAPRGRRLAALWPFALVAGLALLGLALRRAPSARRGLRRVALALAAGGGAIVAATAIAKALVLTTFDTSRGHAVVSTIWNAYLEDLRLWGLAAGALALVVAAAVEPGARGAWRRGLARLSAPVGARGRLARSGALVVLAVLLISAPEVPLDLALVGLAGALVFTAAAEVVRITAR